MIQPLKINTESSEVLNKYINNIQIYIRYINFTYLKIATINIVTLVIYFSNNRTHMYIYM